MNIEKALGVDNIPRYYITHESANESLVLTEKEFEDLRNQINLMLLQEPTKSKPKLIVHDTNCHGQGNVIYNSKVEYYSYDDTTDMRQAVEMLLDLGFLKHEEVLIIEGDDIYDYLKEV